MVSMTPLYAKDSKQQISDPFLVDALAEELGGCLERFPKT
jgi:hypothetical protein